MQHPEIRTLGALKLCSRSKNISQVRRVHQLAISSGLGNNIFLASALISAFSKCGSLGDAIAIFRSILKPDVVAWTAIISAYAQNGQPGKSFEVFSQMQECYPTSPTYIALLRACSCFSEKETPRNIAGHLLKIRTLELVMAVHSHAEATLGDSDQNPRLATLLTDLYSKCGSTADARYVFNKIREPDVVAWSAYVSGLVHNGEADMALELFSQMVGDGGLKLDSTSFVAGLKACSSLEIEQSPSNSAVRLRSLENAMAVHAEASKRGLDLELSLANTLVDLYFKCGSVEDALRVFYRIRNPDVASWTAVILGLARNLQGGLALEFFNEMQAKACVMDRSACLAVIKACSSLAESGRNNEKSLEFLEKGMAVHARVKSSNSELELDPQVSSSLVDMYGKLGSMADARHVFDEFSHPDVVLWNALMFGYLENDEPEHALEAFAWLTSEGFPPSTRSFVAALKACGSLSDMKLGKTLHAGLLRIGITGDAAVANSLVDLYAKCGCIAEAERVAESMWKRDVVTWNSLLAGYSSGKEPHFVFEALHRMQDEGLRPDGVSFVGVLSACSCAGLIERGRRCFAAMWPEFGVAPGLQHYHCLIDMHGRGIRLEEATQLMKLMPFEANDVTWTTLLDACRTQSLL